MRRSARTAALTAAALAALAAAGATAAWLAFDPDGLKPRVEAAVLRATGRALTLDGPLRLTLLPQPGFSAQDVALANLPGGSRPQMVTARRLAARFSLGALLRGRIEVTGLLLDGPDLLLERTPSGPNWVFAPRPSTAPADAAPAPSSAPERRARPLDIRALRVTDGRIAWGGTALSIPSLAATQDATAVHVDASLAHDGAPFALQADTGPVAAIATPEGTPPPAGTAAAPAPAAGAPWPVDATLSTPAGDRLGAKGSLTRDGGYDLALHGAVADLSALNALFPHANLPPVKALRLDGHVAATAGGPPVISALTLAAGASDLGSVRPGLAVSSAILEQRDATGPTRLSLRAAQEGQPVSLDGTVGPMAGADARTLPLDLTAAAAGAVATLRGTAALRTGPAPGAARGIALDLAVSLHAPQLAALSEVVGAGLPALRDLAAEATLSTPSPGVLAVRGLRATSAAGDLAGDLALGRAPRPSLRGTLVSTRIDGDALVLALQQTPRLIVTASPPPAAPRATSPAAAPSPTAPAPSAGAGQGAPAPTATSAPSGVIPDRPLPFAALGAADLDLAFTVGALSAGGVTWRDAAGHLTLDDARLALDPFAAAAADGPVAVRLRVDGRAAPPTVSVAARIPDLPLAPLLAAAGHAGAASGLLGLDAVLDAAGASLRALAATATGHVGLSGVNGEVQDSVLKAAFAPALRAAGIPSPALDGTTAVRCLAVRLDLASGQGTLKALALDSARLRLDGAGTLDLRAELLALTLRPTLRLGGTAVGVPVALDGPLGSPRARVDSARGGGLTIGGGEGPDLCPAALATARGGMSGPAPSAPAAPAKAPKAADLLRSLLR
ncbi:MAG: AsmA family protein [Janthinobacterium lividum]